MSTTVEPPEVAPRQGGAHLARTVAIVVGVLVVALVALLATHKSSNEQVARSEVVGKAVPSVKGTTLAGARFDVDQHLGQWVVIDFFGSWCVPCQAEQVELVKFAQQHQGDPNVAMVGIMYTDKKSDAAGLLPAHRGELADPQRRRLDGADVRGDRRARDLRGQPQRPGGGQVRSGDHRHRAERRDPALRRRVDLVDHRHLQRRLRQRERHTVTDSAPSVAGSPGAPAASAAPADRAPSVGRLLRVYGPWVVMVVIVATALGIGVTGTTGPTTNEGRMLAIAGTLKCQVCEGESVAQSDSDFAQQARVDIAKRLDEGQSASQIRAFYIQHYGASVSLIPASSGISGLVWIIPVVALLVSAAVLVMVFRRWQVKGDVHASQADRDLVADALARSPSDRPAAPVATDADAGSST